MVQEKNWDNHVTCSSIDLSANAVKKKKKVYIWEPKCPSKSVRTQFTFEVINNCTLCPSQEEATLPE